jgi:hypothetical protein
LPLTSICPSSAWAPTWPARRELRVAVVLFRLEVEPAELVLRAGVAEIGGRVGEQLARPRDVRLDRAVLDSVEVVLAELDESARHERRLRRVRRVLGMGVRHLREQLERLEVVLGDAVAVLVHAAELPLRDRMAAPGGVAERIDGLGLVAREVGLGAGPEQVGRVLVGRRHPVGGRLRGRVERPGRRRHGHEPDRDGPTDPTKRDTHDRTHHFTHRQPHGASRPRRRPRGDEQAIPGARSPRTVQPIVRPEP